MKYNVYVIRDIKTGFLTPTIDQNDPSAIRGFENAVLNANNNLFFTHPEDYSLFRIGSYDSETGSIIPEMPEELVTAMQVYAIRERKGRDERGDE